jgi:PTH1 family peptidyl-tRNA hydrolase
MKIIVGLGNPGSEYAGTRHNTGFMAIDTFAAKHDAAFINKPKFSADIAEATIDGAKALLVKPTTFYNETGMAARKLIDFYKLEPSEDLLVIHDDLALPFGTIRIRKKGSDAGNNGIKSLNTRISPDYTRIRVGIHTDGRADDTAFVLSRFSSSEVKVLKEDLIPKAEEFIADFVASDLKETSYKMHSAS